MWASYSGFRSLYIDIIFNLSESDISHAKKPFLSKQIETLGRKFTENFKHNFKLQRIFVIYKITEYTRAAEVWSGHLTG